MFKQTSSFLLVLVLVASLILFTTVIVNAQVPITYPTKHITGIPVHTFDGYLLHADCVVPQLPAGSSEIFPMFICPNSWAAKETEYVGKLKEYGQEGYIGCEYQARGWFNSTGEIDCTGPLDQKDITTVIDTLFGLAKKDSWPLDESKGATFLGISYGAGLTLQAAGVDSRVKVVVAMSGWANLSHTLYDKESPAIAYGSLLIAMSELFGKPIPELLNMWNDMLTGHNISRLFKFCNDRSPGLHLDVINKKGVKVFLSNNYDDRLFRPENVLEDFWNKLTVPKFMLLNQGMHAQPETSGIKFGVDTYIWRHAKRWMDYWLKGIPTGITQEPPLHAQIHGTNRRRKFADWPDTGATETWTYAVNARGSNAFESPFGSLKFVNSTKSSSSSPRKNNKISVNVDNNNNNKPPPLAEKLKLFSSKKQQQQQKSVPFSVSSSSSPRSRNSIKFTTKPGINSGPPVIGDYDAEQLNESIKTELLLVPQENAVIYMTDKFEEQFTLCGSAVFNVPTRSSQRLWQWYGFLYHVDEFDVGTLIADSYWTCWDNCPRPDQDLVFRFICRKVPAGSRLAVGIAMYDNLYQPASNATDLTLWLNATGNPANSYLRFDVAMD